MAPAGQKSIKPVHFWNYRNNHSNKQNNQLFQAHLHELTYRGTLTPGAINNTWGTPKDLPHWAAPEVLGEMLRDPNGRRMELNWQQTQDQCASLGGRLPTLWELGLEYSAPAAPDELLSKEFHPDWEKIQPLDEEPFYYNYQNFFRDGTAVEKIRGRARYHFWTSSRCATQPEAAYTIFGMYGTFSIKERNTNDLKSVRCLFTR